MAEYDCIMKTRDRACELTKRGRKHTLKLGIKMNEMHYQELRSKDDNRPMIVSALQMKRILRKPKQLDFERSILMLVREVDSKPEILKNVQDEEVKNLILEFKAITAEIEGVIHREDDVELDIQTHKDAKPLLGTSLD